MGTTELERQTGDQNQRLLTSGPERHAQREAEVAPRGGRLGQSQFHQM